MDADKIRSVGLCDKNQTTAIFERQRTASLEAKKYSYVEEENEIQVVGTEPS